MTLAARLHARAQNKWRRYIVDRVARRPFSLRADVPYISFTFDDFPQSALVEGGHILSDHDARGTYFVSLGLLNSDSCVGQTASHEDLEVLLEAGHELGCHTFGHLDGWNSTVEAFEAAILDNQAAMTRVAPGVRLPVFAYPLDGPVPAIKRAVGRHFVCCRGGGQTFNRGTVDLNLLKAYFLDWRNADDVGTVARLIEQNSAARGWLIFATHDVTQRPSRYGCKPTFFNEVVRLAVRSGARVVPVARACEELGIPNQ